MNVLITGGTGLIGKRLSELLKIHGHSVSILSRSKKETNQTKYYLWNIDKQEIESEAIEKADVIVHLAGTNVGKGKWTKKRKKEIIDSRIKSGKLLFDAVKEHNPHLKAFISSSAIGYYGMVNSNHVFTESDPPGKDFLAKVCILWEETALQFQSLNIRTAVIRTGVVLDKNEGALSKLLTPIKLGIGSALGSGKQALPWIHLDDISGIYLKAIEDYSMSGMFNGVAPHQVTNIEFSRLVAETLKKPFWFPKVPKFILTLLMGEQAVIALKGSPISSEKIEEAGYQFKYGNLRSALNQLLK